MLIVVGQTQLRNSNLAIQDPPDNLFDLSSKTVQKEVGYCLNTIAK